MVNMILMGKRQRSTNSLAQNYFLPQQAYRILLFMKETEKKPHRSGWVCEQPRVPESNTH